MKKKEIQAEETYAYKGFFFLLVSHNQTFFFVQNKKNEKNENSNISFFFCFSLIALLFGRVYHVAAVDEESDCN
jgi:hypothetical protein